MVGCRGVGGVRESGLNKKRACGVRGGGVGVERLSASWEFGYGGIHGVYLYVCNL